MEAVCVRMIAPTGLLAEIFSGAVCAQTNTGSVAAEAESPPAGKLQEVVVTGIRRSLSDSAEIKKQAIEVVDAIAAEDIGKFPDTNIAEALQRIPGVTIDRQGGEGRFVTVRGFGPSFNTVLVNGRATTTEELGGGSR